MQYLLFYPLRHGRRLHKNQRVDASAELALRAWRKVS